MSAGRARRLAAGTLATTLALGAGFAVWLPCVHLIYRPRVQAALPRAEGIAPRARALLDRQLALWDDPVARAREVEAMRRGNAEWDFMGRTFRVLALAEAALREPGLEPRALAAIDHVIAETTRLEAERGQLHFLLPYARHGSFRGRAERSPGGPGAADRAPRGPASWTGPQPARGEHGRASPARTC